MKQPEQKKYKILFIAKNIPVPGVLPSRVVIDIAHQISTFAEVKFVYPKEIVPFGLQYFKKYKPFYRLQPWNYEGFHVDVLSYIRIPVRKMAFSLWNGLSKKSKEYYQKNGPFDLIHAHYLFPDGYLAYLFGKKYGVPYVITIRNSDLVLLKKLSANDPDYKKAENAIGHAAKILCLNKSYKTFIDQKFHIHTEIIPHGIEPEAYAPDLSTPDKVRIITVSSAIKRKNIQWIIRAFKNYKGRQSIGLEIYGEGVLLEELKQLAGDDPRIGFRGKVPRGQVLRALQHSDIFALPSYDETYGLTYVEAAANHNALIGLKNEGVWGIFEENHEMLFSTDESDFQEKLHLLIDQNELRERLKQRAFLNAKKLNWLKIKDIYEKTYQKVVEDCNRR